VSPADIVYGIIPRSFSPDGLRGVQDRLPYLASIGITMVWLSPIFEHSPGDFGYAMTNYRGIAPEHGTADDLRNLVGEAHRLGIRVLLDFAPNHTSDRHPFYDDAQTNGAASPYADFYATGDDGGPTHYFHWTNLINLNYANAEVRAVVVEAMQYWLREFDVDGYRMDAAWGIRQRTPSFWPACVDALRATKPDVFLLAEASALDPYYRDAGFDSAYDWTQHLGTWAWNHAFDDPATLASDLRYHLTRSSDDASIFRFLNNNDTGVRFITTHGLPLYKLATAMLLTLPGLPCLYMGDEIGMEFRPYHQCGALTWTDDDDLRQFHQRLITLRKTHHVSSGSLTMVATNRPEHCLGYVQPGLPGRRLVSLFNVGPPAEITARLAPPPSASAVDLWTGQPVQLVDATVSVQLDHLAFAIVELTER
jgi:cyclomaltodextrinase / maltogenic alpha-amylase / neopullulanase